MDKFKKNHLFCCLLSLAICAVLAVPAAWAAAPTTLSAIEKANALHELGLLNGNGLNEDGTPNYDMEGRASRNAAAAMLIRLLGKESKAAAQYSAGALKNPFRDAQDWAIANVAWLYEAGQINGTSPTTFNGVAPVTSRQFAAMILRTLGYSESNGDFNYDAAPDFAVQKGLLTEQQRQTYAEDFRREGMIEMCYNALYLNMKNSRLTLLQKLTNDGLFRSAGMNAVSDATPVRLTLKYSGGGHTDDNLGKYYIEDPANTASPCADVDGDGNPEIIFNVRTVFCLNAANGKIKWSAPNGHDVSDRSGESAGIPSLYVPTQIADLDGDGSLEIITFTWMTDTDRTFVGIYDGTGHFKTHWIMPYRVWAAKIADLDGDGKQEIALGLGVGEHNRYDNALAVYLYDCNGSLKDGWPQDCGYGLFSNSIDAADLDGDGVKELVMLTDQEWLNAYKIDGTEVTVTDGFYAGHRWRDIGVFESSDYEKSVISGNAVNDGTRESLNSIMGTHSGIVADDLDGDGSIELACTAMIVNLKTVSDIMDVGELDTFNSIAQYFTAFILKPDHSRYTNPAKGFDWTQMPTDIGDIVMMESLSLPNPDIAPIAADLDGDGNKEIIFASYDGKVHCFHLDGTEHGAWPYALDSRSTEIPSFASKPAAADLNGDGRPEVIFTTYTPNTQRGQRGKLYVLDYSGKVLAEETLPVRWGKDTDDEYANGSEAEPVLADVDNDGKLEIIVTTFSRGVCVYEVG